MNVCDYLKDKKDILFICFFSILIFLYEYWSNPIRPSVVYEIGWFGWNDQGIYYNMAKSLSMGIFNSEVYRAGIGYPITGALFYNIYPKDPFFIPNIILFTISNVLWYLIAKEIFVKREEALFAMMLLNLATPFPDYFVVPWSTTVTAFGLSLICYFLIKNNLNYTKTVIIAIIAGWMFSARYLDAIFVLPVIVLGLYNMRKKIAFKRHLCLFLILFTLFVSFTLITHQIVFGSYFNTPYHDHLRKAIGTNVQDIEAFDLMRVPFSFYAIIVNPYYLSSFATDKPLLGSSPFFVLSLVGFLICFYKMVDKRWFFVSLSINIFLLGIFYLSSITFTADGLKYNIFRVFVMFFPILTITSLSSLLAIFNYSNNSNKEKNLIKIGLVTTAAIILLPAIFYALNPSPIPATISLEPVNTKQTYNISEEITVIAFLQDGKGTGVQGKDVRGAYVLNGTRQMNKLQFRDTGNGSYIASFVIRTPGKYIIRANYIEMPQIVPEIQVMVQNQSTVT